MKLLSSILAEMRKLATLELEKIDIDSIIYDAIKHGIIEFIIKMIKYKPDIIRRKDRKGRTIFAHAIILRQEKIFSLIHCLGAKKNIIARGYDVFRNIYTSCCKVISSNNRHNVPGAALQMQRELQWKSGSRPKLKEEVNENNKTPQVLFIDEHKQLMRDAESWMKSTVGSSMVVDTLIPAVMFTTAFTVPGGN
ncbi:UNVERIFIED_CONTAM: hypothetical protein Slati_0149700 [Sesamum latifolium]|uniref:Uncharacterized protein n=1 Tax=Sesamum latifolium TaxID=2727402 RepID=A0AAW2YAF7_9LAMI